MLYLVNLQLVDQVFQAWNEICEFIDDLEADFDINCKYYLVILENLKTDSSLNRDFVFQQFVTAMASRSMQTTY